MDLRGNMFKDGLTLEIPYTRPNVTLLGSDMDCVQSLKRDEKARTNATTCEILTTYVS